MHLAQSTQKVHQINHLRHYFAPLQVTYIEAHGTGTQAGDPQEVNTQANVFTKDRLNPLLLGSVKSNIGHTEGAAGLASIAKVIHDKYLETKNQYV